MNQLDQLQRLIHEEKTKFDQEMLRLSKPITLESSVEYSPGFSEDTLVIVLTFVFVAITRGALSAIGKDTWSKIKKACQEIVSKSDQTRDKTMIHLKAEFHLSNSERRIVYVLKDPLMVSIDTFWDKTYLDVVVDITNHQAATKREASVVVRELIQEGQKLRWKVKEYTTEGENHV